MYDFIGDIHGHSDKLKALLEKLGYKMQGGVYQHPTRKAFFLGDFIDRGPKILEVLNIVIPMFEKGSALSVMGNHEYNYLSFHTQTKTGDGKYLRDRTVKNIEQCQETIDQLVTPFSKSENQRLLDWIWHLPLWFETESFRAVHACWDDKSIANIKSTNFNSLMNEDLLHSSAIKNSHSYEAIEILLKGKEVKLPPELYFKDKDQNERKEARVCWWDISRKILIPTKGLDPKIYEMHKKNLQVEDEKIPKPTFFGHYWEKWPTKEINPKAVCLDFSVANEGHLGAYRFDGEDELTSDKLIHV